MAKEKPRRDDPTGARDKDRQEPMIEMLYSNAHGSATGIAVSRRKIRNILRLLGCSRQELAFRALKATVFEGDCPAAPILPVHESPIQTAEAATENGGIKTMPALVRPFHPAALKVSGQPPRGRLQVSVSAD